MGRTGAAQTTLRKYWRPDICQTPEDKQVKAATFESTLPNEILLLVVHLYVPATSDPLMSLRAVSRTLNSIVLAYLRKLSNNHNPHPFSSLCFSMDPATLHRLDMLSQSNDIRDLPWLITYDFVDPALMLTPKRYSVDFFKTTPWSDRYGDAWGAFMLYLIGIRRDCRNDQEFVFYEHDTLLEARLLTQYQKQYATYLKSRAGQKLLKEVMSKFPKLQGFTLGCYPDTAYYDENLTSYVLSSEVYELNRTLRKLVDLEQSLRGPRLVKSQYGGVIALLKVVSKLRLSPSSFEIWETDAGAYAKNGVLKHVMSVRLDSITTLCIGITDAKGLNKVRSFLLRLNCHQLFLCGS